MPALEEQLVTIVYASPALTGLIGSSPARYFPDVKPQGATSPLIVFQRISTPREHTLDGKSTLAHPRIQLTVFAPDPAVRHNVKTAIRQTFAGYRDIEQGGTISGIVVTNEQDTYTPETRNYGATLDLIVWHSEP